MAYVIYDVKTTRFVRVFRNGYWQDAEYKTKGAATAAFNRMLAEKQVTPSTHAVSEKGEFHSRIEKSETKHNLLSGKPFTQPVNTPLCCDPSSETYWSM